jgi:propanol-preferring alcohol dehydrogenase
MKAMVLRHTALLSDDPSPLHLVELPTPTPAADEVLLRVLACGVCHTELDEIEGRLPPPRLPIVLGHEVVGRVEELGGDVSELSIGQRMGVGWIHCSSGEPDENLSPEFMATGCDVNGGYAQFMTVPARYAVPIPESFSDEQAAPLMCAGAIGFRALRLTGIADGDALGLMGFGGSAHLVLQTTKHLYPKSPVYVFAREPAVREFALDLGADWAGAIDQDAPQLVRSVIDTTPAWRPVVASMQKLAPGGRLVINAIRKESTDQQSLLDLNYHEHLWMEREIKSVANLTLRDIADFLPMAAQIPIRPEVAVYPLEEANEALCDLRRGRIRGANVLRVAHN